MKKTQGHRISGSILIVLKDIVKMCPKFGNNKQAIYYTKWEKRMPKQRFTKT